MQVFRVGGSVRDELLGRPVSDEDFVVVGATHQDMVDAGYRQVGSDFPVYLHPRTGEEYALARTERKSGTGYHGFSVSFDPSTTLYDDLARRDLTINAMARDIDDQLYDPFGGFDDLQNGILRHVSDAFAEDPLRVLRIARFQARYGFSIANETVELMRQLVNDGEINNLTPERVWAEFKKAMMEEHPMMFFWALRQCGALDVLFVELAPHIIDVMASVKRASLRDAPFEHRVLLLFNPLDVTDAYKLLNQDLRAPSHLTRLVTKMLTINQYVDNQAMTPSQVLSCLSKIDVFRQPNDLVEIIKALVFVRSEVYQDHLDCIVRCNRVAQRVSFATLTGYEQQNLDGRQIGQAIDRQRLQAITEVL